MMTDAAENVHELQIRWGTCCNVWGLTILTSRFVVRNVLEL